MAENQTMSSWDRIRQGVADVENLMDQKQYNLSMVRGRQTLDYMINYLAQSVRLQSPDMSTTVDELYNLKVISAESRENYHSIRTLGNRAAHEGNNSASDAAASYQMLSREVYAFANSYAKAARQIGQMIRNSRMTPNRQAGAGSYAIDPKPEIGLPKTRRSPSYTAADAGTGAASGRNAAAGTSYAQRSGARTGAASGTRAANADGGRQTSAARASRTTPGRTSPARRPARSKATIAGVSPELILKIMIPVILVVLLIAVIKFTTSKSSKDNAQTSAVQTSASVAETMQVVTAAAVPVETTQAPTEPETQAAVYRYTTTEGLNVRTAPGTDAGKVAVLEVGTEVDFIEQVDEKWAKINYNGSEAYVAVQYLKKEQVQ